MNRRPEIWQQQARRFIVEQGFAGICSGLLLVLGFDCVIPTVDRFVDMLCVVPYGSNKP